jgi:hypothetical protein
LILFGKHVITSLLLFEQMVCFFFQKRMSFPQTLQVNTLSPHLEHGQHLDLPSQVPIQLIRKRVLLFSLVQVQSPLVGILKIVEIETQQVT